MQKKTATKANEFLIRVVGIMAAIITVLRHRPGGAGRVFSAAAVVK
jgi:hypothetical protein